MNKLEKVLNRCSKESRSEILKGKAIYRRIYPSKKFPNILLWKKLIPIMNFCFKISVSYKIRTVVFYTDNITINFYLNPAVFISIGYYFKEKNTLHIYKALEGNFYDKNTYFFRQCRINRFYNFFKNHVIENFNFLNKDLELFACELANILYLNINNIKSLNEEMHLALNNSKPRLDILNFSVAGSVSGSTPEECWIAIDIYIRKSDLMKYTLDIHGNKVTISKEDLLNPSILKIF